jgi:4'-phosphopantetheinyl transferase
MMMGSTPDRSWAPGPSEPLIGEDAVHVWRVDLSAVSGDLVALLGAEEHARAERFLREGDRERWMRSRGVLRALLGRYLRKDPRTLRFTFGPHGKPALREERARSNGARQSRSTGDARISFNLTHSGQHALYAFSGMGAVGVDLEVGPRAIDEVAVAARALGATEARRLERLEPPIREREFLRAWVRHEAVLKCRGTGIGGGATRASGGEPWITELDVGPQATAALALDCVPRELRCWEFPG